jgi:4-hydroxybenzoate polyprenyltransferase
MKICYYIWQSLRPKQWPKNLAIFVGILFSQNILNLPLLAKTIIAFLIFCLLSGAVYILNDITDLEKDRRHPVKSQRPLASGRLRVSHAIFIFVVIIAFALGLSYYVSLSFFLVAVAYFLLQLAYSFSLKRIVILDVFAIAAGFVLRVVAGTVVINVEFSSWLLICTILLALFLGLSKRRHELVVLGEEAQNHRTVLAEYSPYLLDQMISVVTASTLVAYCLYTMSEETIAKFGTRNLIFTIPFVLYGIFRYLYLIHQKGKGGSPENILLNDKPLLVAIFLWIITVGIVLYG